MRLVPQYPNQVATNQSPGPANPPRTPFPVTDRANCPLDSAPAPGGDAGSVITRAVRDTPIRFPGGPLTCTPSDTPYTWPPSPPAPCSPQPAAPPAPAARPRPHRKPPPPQPQPHRQPPPPPLRRHRRPPPSPPRLSPSSPWFRHQPPLPRRPPPWPRPHRPRRHHLRNLPQRSPRPPSTTRLARTRNAPAPPPSTAATPATAPTWTATATESPARNNLSPHENALEQTSSRRLPARLHARRALGHLYRRSARPLWSKPSFPALAWSGARWGSWSGGGGRAAELVGAVGGRA